MSRDYSEAELRWLAQERDMDFVDAERAYVPEGILESIPASVAREVPCLPFAWQDGAMQVVVCDPDDPEILDKLRFILDRQILPAYAVRRALEGAIERLYGVA